MFFGDEDETGWATGDDEAPQAAAAAQLHVGNGNRDEGGSRYRSVASTGAAETEIEREDGRDAHEETFAIPRPSLSLTAAVQTALAEHGGLKNIVSSLSDSPPKSFMETLAKHATWEDLEELMADRRGGELFGERNKKGMVHMLRVACREDRTLVLRFMQEKGNIDLYQRRNTYVQVPAEALGGRKRHSYFTVDGLPALLLLEACKGGAVGIVDFLREGAHLFPVSIEFGPEGQILSTVSSRQLEVVNMALDESRHLIEGGAEKFEDVIECVGDLGYLCEEVHGESKTKQVRAFESLAPLTVFFNNRELPYRLPGGSSSSDDGDGSGPLEEVPDPSMRRGGSVSVARGVSGEAKMEVRRNMNREGISGAMPAKKRECLFFNQRPLQRVSPTHIYFKGKFLQLARKLVGPGEGEVYSHADLTGFRVKCQSPVYFYEKALRGASTEEVELLLRSNKSLEVHAQFEHSGPSSPCWHRLLGLLMGSVKGSNDEVLRFVLDLSHVDLRLDALWDLRCWGGRFLRAPLGLLLLEEAAIWSTPETFILLAQKCIRGGLDAVDPFVLRAMAFARRFELLRALKREFLLSSRQFVPVVEFWCEEFEWPDEDFTEALEQLGQGLPEFPPERRKGKGKGADVSERGLEESGQQERSDRRIHVEREEQMRGRGSAASHDRTNGARDEWDATRPVILRVDRDRDRGGGGEDEGSRPPRPLPSAEERNRFAERDRRDRYPVPDSDELDDRFMLEGRESQSFWEEIASREDDSRPWRHSGGSRVGELNGGFADDPRLRVDTGREEWDREWERDREEDTYSDGGWGFDGGWERDSEREFWSETGNTDRQLVSWRDDHREREVKERRGMPQDDVSSRGGGRYTDRDAYEYQGASRDGYGDRDMARSRKEGDRYPGLEEDRVSERGRDRDRDQEDEKLRDREEKRVRDRHRQPGEGEGAKDREMARSRKERDRYPGLEEDRVSERGRDRDRDQEDEKLRDREEKRVRDRHRQPGEGEGAKDRDMARSRKEGDRYPGLEEDRVSERGRDRDRDQEDEKLRGSDRDGHHEERSARDGESHRQPGEGEGAEDQEKRTDRDRENDNDGWDAERKRLKEEWERDIKQSKEWERAQQKERVKNREKDGLSRFAPPPLDPLLFQWGYEERDFRGEVPPAIEYHPVDFSHELQVEVRGVEGWSTDLQEEGKAGEEERGKGIPQAEWEALSDSMYKQNTGWAPERVSVSGQEEKPKMTFRKSAKKKSADDWENSFDVILKVSERTEQKKRAKREQRERERKLKEQNEALARAQNTAQPPSGSRDPLPAAPTIPPVSVTTSVSASNKEKQSKAPPDIAWLSQVLSGPSPTAPPDPLTSSVPASVPDEKQRLERGVPIRCVPCAPSSSSVSFPLPPGPPPEGPKTVSQELQRVTEQTAEEKEVQRVTEQTAEGKEVERVTEQTAEEKEVQRVTEQTAEEKEVERVTEQTAEEDEGERVTEQTAEEDEGERVTWQTAKEKERERVSGQTAEKKEGERVTEQTGEEAQPIEPPLRLHTALEQIQQPESLAPSASVKADTRSHVSLPTTVPPSLSHSHPNSQEAAAVAAAESRGSAKVPTTSPPCDVRPSLVFCFDLAVQFELRRPDLRALCSKKRKQVLRFAGKRALSADDLVWLTAPYPGGGGLSLDAEPGPPSSSSSSEEDFLFLLGVLMREAVKMDKVFALEWAWTMMKEKRRDLQKQEHSLVLGGGGQSQTALPGRISALVEELVEISVDEYSSASKQWLEERKREGLDLEPS
uniref:Uncharacterized protein n=1 Tax=Chromera velia CCMP2878 TaxID=1169474 RepID=A0A0G4I7U5_9ALVE|eukprot:Cvel_11760.t1-p1 / transcript=Cvel_11760.t1 / gene=Cvel_11760 / organism=Chromera_velia_CCMP2878 / gene_product=Transcriptional regulator ICP22 homolog, putative / transcript_product=Transcriptional regulator ICP22 homolog, putative / location=Cvel_scaffold747:42429-49174(-) / protein_length=1765 / sequence_SO=supercontig / SO=protein_coding / is_pseudo=false